MTSVKLEKKSLRIQYYFSLINMSCCLLVALGFPCIGKCIAAAQWIRLAQASNSGTPSTVPCSTVSKKVNWYERENPAHPVVLRLVTGFLPSVSAPSEQESTVSLLSSSSPFFPEMVTYSYIYEYLYVFMCVYWVESMYSYVWLGMDFFLF